MKILIALLGYSAISLSNQALNQQQPVNNQQQLEEQHVLPDDADIPPVDPDAYLPRTYVPGEKKGIKLDLERTSSDQLLIQERRDSKTQKERKEGPSMPAKPNKGGGQLI